VKASAAEMAGFLSGLDLRTARRGRIATAPRVRMQERHFIDEYEIHGTPRAVRNNVLVKVAEAEEVTSGGLILATVAVEKPNYGTVISTGTGYSYATTGFKVPMVVKEGDTVMYGKYGFEPLQIDDEEHAVVSQDAVLAKVNGEYKAENVEPIYDTIFIRRDDADESLSSGVVLSARAKIKPNTGKVGKSVPQQRHRGPLKVRLWGTVCRISIADFGCRPWTADGERQIRRITLQSWRQSMPW